MYFYGYEGQDPYYYHHSLYNFLSEFRNEIGDKEIFQFRKIIQGGGICRLKKEKPLSINSCGKIICKDFFSINKGVRCIYNPYLFKETGKTWRLINGEIKKIKDIKIKRQVGVNECFGIK
jgi:hypothetical protein